MKKTLLLVGVMISMLLFGAVTVSAQEDACAQKGGQWHADTQKCEIQNAIEVDIAYPLELAQNDFAAQEIDGFLSRTRTDFLSAYAATNLVDTAMFPWGMTIDYDLYQFSDTIQSVNFSIYSYTGGAHGLTMFQTYIFDLAANRVITFNDLFSVADPLATIAPIVEQDLAAQLGEAADASWIHDGTGNSPDNYQSFVVTSDALIFIFPPYQVAAYAAGPQTVSIPLAQISGILAPPFAG